MIRPGKRCCCIPVVCWFALAAILATAHLAAAADKAAPKVGEVVFAADFEDPQALAGWSGDKQAATLDAGFESKRALRIQAPTTRGARVQVSLPVKRFRGCKLLAAAHVRAKEVSKKPKEWNGIKFMMPIVTTGKERHWPQAPLEVGTFGWRRVSWNVYVPADAETLGLHLGLEQVSGTVWFDNIRISVRRLPPPPPSGRPTGPVFKGHSLPRLRGAMVSTRTSAADLRTLGREWKANVVRWQLFGFRPRFDTGDLALYNRKLDEELKKLDAALKVCEEVGLMVVVDLHTGPGHWAKGERNLFASKACQDLFVANWERMARRYKNVRCIWGYDLLNEPLEDSAAEGVADWQELAERATRAIRTIDSERAIIVEPAPWGGPDAIANLRPLPVKNVVYSVHMYKPHQFTHQGVHDPKAKPLAYPGMIDGKYWDKAELEKALKPVIDFQKNYGVHIFLGEFSAIRWAPDHSAYRYIRDCIEIFEKHDWDWTYHAFREWSGWSVEHVGGRSAAKLAETPTRRKKTLLAWYAKNKKPKRQAASPLSRKR